jgi:uncharacterized protein (TIGR01777 family)
MKIFVTGGTGFVGSRLVPFLRENGHRVQLLARPDERESLLPEGVEACDAAVNMAGAPILGKWTTKTKALIRESRVTTTRNLANAVPAGKGFTLISTSAVGIYGDAADRELDEDAPLGNDFLARVAREWEAAATMAGSRGCRVVITRFGIVLAHGGGAIEQFQQMTRRAVGGPVASGRQWLAWIHREDLVRAMLFLLERPDLDGIFNLCAPNPARQIDVARILGKLLGRPALAPAPAFAARLLLGEFANVVLFSQKAVPRRLLEAGFTFRFPDLQGALRDILKPEHGPNQSP